MHSCESGQRIYSPYITYTYGKIRFLHAQIIVSKLMKIISYIWKLKNVSRCQMMLVDVIFEFRCFVSYPKISYLKVYFIQWNLYEGARAGETLWHPPFSSYLLFKNENNIKNTSHFTRIAYDTAC